MPDRTHIELEATQRGGHRLGELTAVFLRLGVISFGGPAGHIALMEDELVRRRGWLSREKFLDLLGAVNLLPGPNSTEMALYIGLLRAGGAGLLVAGISFILPAAILVGSLCLYCLKVGAVLFGSGYLLLAFLRADLVERWHWLTEAQLLDAIAVSQVTPGPLSTAATFIGYVLAGPWGALLATIAIFLPGFVLVAASGRLVPRLRQSPVASAFLDGVNVAALALMTAVSWQLGRAALLDWTTMGIAAVSAVLLLRFRVNSAWLVLGGAVAGLAASALRAR